VTDAGLQGWLGLRAPFDPKAAVLVEDMAQNLKPAKALGMTTVWVDNGSERGAHLAEDGQVDFVIADVGDWLEDILGGDNDD